MQVAQLLKRTKYSGQVQWTASTVGCKYSGLYVQWASTVSARCKHHALQVLHALHALHAGVVVP